MKKRAVILLGAGAAKAWGAILTPEITELVVNDKNFLTISGQPLGKYVFDRLTEFYKGSIGINFETILNSLEILQSHFMNRDFFGGNPNVTSSSTMWFDCDAKVNEILNYWYTENTHIDGRGTLKNKSNKDNYVCILPERKEAAYLNEAIKHYLFLIKSKIAKYSLQLNGRKHLELNECFYMFIKYLTSLDYIPRIYTTNYDRLVPTILGKYDLDVFDGFDILAGRNSFWGFYSHNLPRILKDLDNICYYCLHGSIFWDYKFNYKEVDYEFVCTPNEYHSAASSNLSEHTNPSESTFVHNVVTGYNKLQRISIEPLSSFRSVFARDCIEADLIITIGYSFSDFHLNRPLLNAFRNKNPNYLHICWCENDIRSSRELICLEKEVLKQKSLLRKDAFIDDKWLRSKDGQQMVYFKGFKEFLINEEWKQLNI